MRPALALLTAVLVLALPAPALAACAGADEVPTEATRAAAATAVLCLVNEARTVRGRARVRWHPLLAFPQMDYAQRMVDGRFFGHAGPDGSSPATRLDLYRVDEADVGEVLAWGGPNRVTPRSALTMWLGSRTHRRIVLARRWRHAGVGAAIGTPFGIPGPSVTWAMAFGEPTPGLLPRAIELLEARRRARG